MSDRDSDEKPQRRRADDDKSAKQPHDRLSEGKQPPLKVIKSEEVRRNMKWVSHTRSRVSFGFQHLSAAYVPAMLEEPHGLCICLEKVSGWSIPAAVLKEFGKGDFEITAQLSFSMFHLSSSTFFGTTWMGPSVSLGHGSTDMVKTIDFEYTDIIYMLSRITDPTCVGIIEVVVSKFDLRKNLVASQFGCGWTIINLFVKPPPADIAEGHENVSITSCSLFTGSPRDLIINTDLKTLASRLKEIPNCSLYFKLYSHRRLLKAHRLIAENEALGRYDIVAGLVPRSVAPPGSTQARMVPCIGDEELMDDHSGVLCLPTTPRLATPCTLKMGNCQMYMPNRRAVEIKMCAEYASMLQLKDASKVLVVSRKLRIGLHNGNTVLGGEWQAHQLIEDKHDQDVLFTPTKSDIVVEGYVPDMYMALAFMVEYELGVPVAKSTHFNSQAMMRSTSWQDGRMVTAFTVCAAIYIPYSGNKLLLRNTGRRPGDEDGVDVELPLLKDEACTILSAKPFLLFNNQEGGGNDGMDAQSKGRLTLRAGEKASSDGDKAAVALEEEDTGSSMLGFDLRVFHPTHGEVFHGEDMTSLLQQDTKKSRARVSADEEDRSLEETRKSLHDRARVVSEGKDDSGDERAVDALGTTRTFKGVDTAFRTRGFAVTASTKGEALRQSFRGNRAREDEDDVASVADSIVTGESGHSSLRLDALYYTAMGRTRDPRSYIGQPGWDSQSERSSEAGIVRGSMALRDSKFHVPRNRDSLLAQSLQAKLVTKDRAGANLDAPGDLLPTSKLHFEDHSHMRIAPKTSIVGINSNGAHMRELSRGARSRLSRHGFDGAIMDTPLDAALGDGAHILNSKYRGSAVSNKNVVVDIDLEARDQLSLHEINIQFAGYRAGATAKTKLPASMDHYTPKAVYFSFQFYSCMPTRTEVMRLLVAEPGDLSVLVRDEAHVRDETPLTLRYFVDCSTASPNEAAEFSEYLAHCSLYVDVWDADSLLHLGTCGIPLRRLMRQGQRVTKQAAECDIINAEVAASSSANGGIRGTVVADGGPLSGTVVGAVQIILSNTGHEGKGPKPHVGPLHHSNNDDFVPLEGLNWRAYGVSQDARLLSGPVSNRPRNSVRAKPLSESSPELHKALTDVRHSADHRQGGASLRSLTDLRGGSGACTLTYDEVAIMFRRFRGPQKGSVQYAGDLLSLLDMPSLSVALKKLVQVYRRFGDYDGLIKEILRHSNAASELGASDVTEALKVMFEKTGVAFRSEELTLLTEKLLSGSSSKGFIGAQQMVEFCADEAERHEWTLVGSRLRLGAQRAALEGMDVEQMLCDHDVDGTHYITTSAFKKFLTSVGSLSPKDVNLCCRHFSRRAPSAEEDRGTVSLKEVMAFLGTEYVGNLQARIRKVLQNAEKGTPDVREMLLILNTASGVVRPKHQALVYSHEELEAAFSMLGVYKEISHDQARNIFKKLDTKSQGKISAAQILTYLGIPFKAADLTMAPSEAAAATSEAYQQVDAEGLLRLLLDKVQSNGIAVDEAFRHFDVNGDGSITRSELVQGLTQLRIFDNVPDWKSQLPALLKKFDVDGNGEVSLREFFKFLGITEYAPNIIQRMTKIFAVASQKKVSVKDIFTHLDSDGSGQLDASELETGLKALGTFGEVTRADAEAVVNHFDKDGDKEVSINEFVTYFTQRVDQALKDRTKRRADRATAILRKTFAGAISKGANMKEIFSHLDKDNSGSIDLKELMVTIKQLPSFKKMTEADMEALLAVLDADGNGDISFDEFEAFLRDGDDPLEDSMGSMGSSSIGALGGFGSLPATLIDRIRDTFKLAEEHGLSFEKAFNLLDRDSSGGITAEEMHAALLKLPNFKNVSMSEVRDLFGVVDADRNGEVSVAEFKNFVKQGKLPTQKKTQSEFSEEKQPVSRHNEPMKPELVKELFIRHMNRISVHDNGVSGLLAYLDDDEDGLIKLSSFKALLRREDVFQAIPEDQVMELLEPMTHDHKHLRAAALLRFVESGRAKSSGRAEGKEDREEELVVLPKEYEFSNDPETRALEKKVRGFGRVLAKKGVDVESIFRTFDPKFSGSVRRTELLEVLAKLGMYLLEQGKILEQATQGEGGDIGRMQMHQVNRLKGKGGDYLQNAPRMARKFLMNGGSGEAGGDFKDHMESMTLVNWYRQSQKQMLLQRVLSHSLAHIIRLYPRFGKTLFFEYPITNPFAHEERFQIEINDPELRLVSAFDEWIHLRRACRPAVGELGNEPVEADMFDRDAAGHFQVALLPHETLHIPFTFMTLLPCIPDNRQSTGPRRSPPNRFQPESKISESNDRDVEYHNDGGSGGAHAEEEAPQRSVEVKVVSGTHGHIVSILKVLVCPRPFVLNRTLRFQEPENSIMKRRVQIVGHEDCSMYPGEYSNAAKYVHCVEGGVPMAATPAAATHGDATSLAAENSKREQQSRVVVEWGPSSEQFSGMGALDLLIRYRCGPFPSTGTFYLLIYNDPYQSQLHEVWQVVVQTRLRLDVHGSVGCASMADLVVRGDRYARRARAYALTSPADSVCFRPDSVFQLVPGAYNRVAVNVSPKIVGHRQVQVNLVDEDSRELVSAWLVTVAATSPAVMRAYDVDVPVGRPLHKKIVFKNPWDVPRSFRLASSDEAIMRPRSVTVEVAALGTAYLRLWFSGLQSGGVGLREVHLFLNDATAGQNEECYLFRIRDV